MSIIDINAEWRVTSDARQWIMERWYVPKEKEDGSHKPPEFKAVSYHPTFQSAVNWYVELTARESDAVGIDALRGVVRMTMAEALDALERYQTEAT